MRSFVKGIFTLEEQEVDGESLFAKIETIEAVKLFVPMNLRSVSQNNMHSNKNILDLYFKTEKAVQYTF